MTKIRRCATTSILCVLVTGMLSAAMHGQITTNNSKSPRIKRTVPAKPTLPVRQGSTTDPGVSDVASGIECQDPSTKVHAEGMRRTLAQAVEYRPGLRSYYLEDLDGRRSEYLRAAISRTRRKEWYEAKNVDQPGMACFEPLFDQIAEAAKRTLPTYRPSGYTLGTKAEFRILRSGVNDLARATVFRIGLEGRRWRISKDNYNFPTARFRYGLIWAKYPDTDDGYCRIIYLNLVQDYAGGGAYGASYANFIKSEPAGCPPGR